jgi:two-component system, OmpR family, sensor histidine kinase KdpD
MMEEEKRPDPDEILRNIRKVEPQGKGKLKIFLGYAAGVGKTYAMLDDAREQYKTGTDVLVGYVEPHTRPDTIELLGGLPTLPPKVIRYKNLGLKEFDLDTALKRKPELILVDELAHSNAEGARNKKRYQDIEELLNAGINVYTTVNVQHIESLNNVVEDITKVVVRETVPDYIFDRAEKVKIVDIDPEELLKRLKQGKIYKADRAKSALQNFFTSDNLSLLREIAIRKAADRISYDNQNERSITDKMANSKFLVCIGTSPSSAKCIRWTARAAEAFHAPWTAVYIENLSSDQLSTGQQNDLKNNMELAAKLGGELITLSGYDIAAMIAEYAKVAGITNIVIGKSRNRKTFRNLLEIDLEDKLISLLPMIEVHIIPGNAVHRIYVNHYKKQVWRKNIHLSWEDTLKSIVMLVAATLISLLLRSLELGDQNIIMLYILSVLIVSRITKGYIYGVVVSILSVLTFNYFFTIPYYTFYTIQPGYSITFLIMLLVALITSALTVRIKNQVTLAVDRERRTELLYEINKKLLATRGLENIVHLTTEYIANIFKRSVIFYTMDIKQGTEGIYLQSYENQPVDFLNKEKEKAVAHWVFSNKKRAGAGTDTLMGAMGFYMPVISQDRVLGVLGISCKEEPLNHDNRLFLRMIASQVAMALERQYLSDEQRKILVDSEKEKMRSNLLRAISHDLRTPLTGILGASSLIQENGNNLDKETHDKLIRNIKEDSGWLIRMVENLLSITRINEGTMNVTKAPEAAEEIVAEAISRTRGRYPGRKITVKVPEELLVVPMDGTLIAQVLMNLLENAIKYTTIDALIEVEVKKGEDEAIFEVADSGTGISEEEFPYLFDSFVPGGSKSADSARGMGIGLSICMSIIKAHGGTLEAENKKTGGAIFRFILPIEGGAENE